MSDFARRLCEIRSRMGLSQTAFARIGGVSKGSQIAYEYGRAQPSTAYLQKLSEAGVNVLWLLTGRSLPPLEIGEDLAGLIDIWLRLGKIGQQQLLHYASGLLGYYGVIETPEQEAERLAKAEAVLARLREGKPPDD
jgi:transcriptional regulator with XRE-family HTH domain